MKRNIERFPADFMFQLTDEEWNTLRSQIATSNAGTTLKSQFATSNTRGGKRYLPYVFTELGVAMLSSVLNNNIAIQMNINIMRAFVVMRHTLIALTSTETKVELLNEKIERLNLYIEEVLHDQNDINEAQRTINEETNMQLELINQSLAELQAKPAARPHRRIGFDVTDDE